MAEKPPPTISASERLFQISHEMLMIRAPQVASTIAGRLEEGPQRDMYLARVINKCVFEHPEIAAEILPRITHPDARARAGAFD